MGMLDRILMGEPLFQKPAINIFDRILMGGSKHIKESPVPMIKSKTVLEYAQKIKASNFMANVKAKPYDIQEHVRRITLAAPYYAFNNGWGPARGPLDIERQWHGEMVIERG